MTINAGLSLFMMVQCRFINRIRCHTSLSTTNLWHRQQTRRYIDAVQIPHILCINLLKYDIVVVVVCWIIIVIACMQNKSYSSKSRKKNEMKMVEMICQPSSYMFPMWYLGYMLCSMSNANKHLIKIIVG